MATSRNTSTEPAPRLRVLNLTRGAVLGESVEMAGTSAARRKGLLGRDALVPGGGLWIVPCESVHTFWMRFPIDLVYLDRGQRVKKVRHSVPAWRMSACLSAHSVLELPAGTAAHTGTQRGDALELSEFAEPSATVTEPTSAGHA
jgi:hypothetical protein